MFQAIFGMIFTVLIALEFNHSILSVLERKESIVSAQLPRHCRERRIFDLTRT